MAGVLPPKRWPRPDLVSLVLMLWSLPLAAQINRITLDMKNDFTWSQTPRIQGNLTSRYHRQYYILGVSGYLLHTRLLQFNMQSTLSDFYSDISSLSMKHSQRTRNLGFYNLSLSMLASSRYPLTLFASRSRAEKTSSNDANSGSASATRAFSGNEVETLGLEWSIAKNSYLPQMRLTVQRNLYGNRGRFTQKSETAGLSLSNSSQNGKSQYLFQYTGSRFISPLSPGARLENELQFHSTSELSPRATMFTHARYTKSGRLITRSAEAGARYRQSDRLRHQVKVVTKENFHLSSRSVSNSVEHQTHAVFSNRYQGLISSGYYLQKSELGQEQKVSDRGQARAQITFNDRLGFAEVTTSMETTVGFETHFGRREYVQLSQFNFNGKSLGLRQVQIALRENMSFAINYDIGATIQNSAHLGIETGVIPRSVVGVELSRSDSKYLEWSTIAQAVTSVGGKVGTRLTPTIMAETRHDVSWKDSPIYRARTLRTRVTVSESGLFRNLSFQIRGERLFNTYTGVEYVAVDGFATFRFFAYAFRLRGSWRSVAGQVTNDIILEVHRLVVLNL